MRPRDLLYAMNGLIRRRAFSATAILSIGVGIGAATTVLSIGIALFARPLPYASPDRLVAIWPQRTLAGREIDAIRHTATSLTRVASVSPGWLMPLTHVATPRQLDAARVNGDLFGLLGVTPALGHAFGRESEVIGQDHVAVLSDALWRSVFGGDRSIVGRSIVLNDEPYTVVAVMPRGFRMFQFTSDLWIPLAEDHSAWGWTGPQALAFGRLASGVTARAASAELATIAPRLQQEFHLESAWPTGARVVGLAESMVGTLRPMILLLTGAVGFLLSLATANVAILLLIRADERRNEMGVRLALGATPGHLSGLLLSESLIIGAVGGIVGVVLSRLGVALVLSILPRALPRIEEIKLNAGVLAASAVLTLIVTIVFGFAPARRVRVPKGRTIASGGERTRGLLISLEMALALILVVGATLMGRTLMALSRVDPGLESDHLLTMKIEPVAPPGDQALRAYWGMVLPRVEAVPGVLSAATILHLPTTGRAWDTDIRIEGQPLAAGASPPQAHWQSVSVGYFRTAGVQLLRGRPFNSTDGPTAPRVIAVNSAFAARLFPGTNPIGRRVRASSATDDSLATIVAVVASVRHDSLTGPPTPEVYVPFTQRAVGATALIVRTTVPPLSIAAAIRGQISSVDPNTPISDMRTMDDLLGASLARQRMMLIVFSMFASIGLLLAAIGVYGVVAFAASQRVKEVGIRMALGANARAIRYLLIGHGLRYATLGAGAGAALALALSRVMRQTVYGVDTTDPASFLFAPAVLALVVTIASWLPARRAAAIEPTVALAREI
jgi:putative ABC transport system permease protein